MRHCQEWDSNPRLHSETRRLAPIVCWEGEQPWVWRLRPLGHPDNCSKNWFPMALLSNVLSTGNGSHTTLNRNTITYHERAITNFPLQLSPLYSWPHRKNSSSALSCFSNNAIFVGFAGNSHENWKISFQMNFWSMKLWDILIQAKLKLL